MLLILVIVALFTTSYDGTDNSGIVFGTEQCHIGVDFEPTRAIFALCYEKE